MRSILIVLVGLVLVGCASTSREKASVASPYSDPMGGTPIYTLAREFAAPGAFLGPAPTAVVILKSEETSRNSAFCSGFIKLDAPLDAVTDPNFAESMLVTRWPLNVTSLPVGDAKNCDKILASYDFARADALRADLIKAGINAKSFDGGGPFIAQFLPTGGVFVVSATGFTEPNLKAFAQKWDGVAGQLNASTTADFEDAADVASPPPKACNIVTDAATGCTIEGMALATAAWVIKKKFPEAEVAIAVGQRVACIFLKPKQKAKWCS